MPYCLACYTVRVTHYFFSQFTGVLYKKRKVPSVSDRPCDRKGHTDDVSRQFVDGIYAAETPDIASSRRNKPCGIHNGLRRVGGQIVVLSKAQQTPDKMGIGPGRRLMAYTPEKRLISAVQRTTNLNGIHRGLKPVVGQIIVLST